MTHGSMLIYKAFGVLRCPYDWIAGYDMFADEAGDA